MRIVDADVLNKPSFSHENDRNGGKRPGESGALNKRQKLIKTEKDEPIFLCPLQRKIGIHYRLKERRSCQERTKNYFSKKWPQKDL